MSNKLHLAKPDDLDRLIPMITAFHEGQGIDRSDDARRASVVPLLEGLPHGAIYLIGPRRAPVGYLVISFGYALGRGGISCQLDEFYVRPAVRGRGMGTEALQGLLTTLGQAGVVAMHVEAMGGEPNVVHLYERLGFSPHTNVTLMTCALQD